MKINLVSVFVNDPREAFAFYTEKLGFIKRLYMPEAWLAIVASPDEPEGTGLMLEPNQNPIAKTYQEGLYQSGIPVIVFSVPDLGAEYERLKGLGIRFKKEPTKTDWGFESVFDDTFGNYIMLIQHEPSASL